MKIYLLSHERELKKTTNTGQIIKNSLGRKVEVHVWKRTEPPGEIVELIDRDEIALLYPNGDESPAHSLPDFENFLILDATWQEARKIYNRSPYLKRARCGSLRPDQPSGYTLRRNQIAGGLSTAECVIELLKMKGHKSLAEMVRVEFDRFNLNRNRSRKGSLCGV